MLDSYDCLYPSTSDRPLMAKDVKRITVTLPLRIAEDLEQWAEWEARPPANWAAFLIESSVRAKLPEKYPPPQLGQ
jgi:hypothetical protein